MKASKLIELLKVAQDKCGDGEVFLSYRVDAEPGLHSAFNDERCIESVRGLDDGTIQISDSH